MVGWLIYRLHLDPLSRIPGPLLAKFVPICNIRMVLTGRMMFTFKELHDTYGPVVRIGPSELSFATHSAFDTIYGPYGDKNFSLYGSRKGLLGSLDKENRRKLRPLVATSLNELLAAKGEEYCHLAMDEQLASHHVGQTEATPVSLSTLNNRYLWQFASMAANGNCGDETDRGTSFTNIFMGLSFMALTQVIAICFIFRQPVHPGEVNYDRDESPFPDNLHSRLQQAASRTSLHVPEYLLQINCFVLRFSIYGTADNMLNALFYFLLRNPQCLKRLEEEVSCVGATVNELSDDRLAKLPYLNACINETFRIAPAFNGGILQRVSCGATVDGVYVPPGVAVSVDHYTLGHDPQYWVKPDVFNPERWIDPDCKDNFKASRPFLIGARQCPGRQMAYQMFRVCVAKLVYLYTFELLNKDFDIERDTFSSYHWTGVKLDVTMKPRTPGVLGY
ncbi:uncharacterized protein An01g14990 [Aspergillus niger]|uniref:Cytochrome P450 monooxygenase aunB n=2 Tax=Aspergillus niger TaxID=5061 RepID=AUNB_ASPNC|nr:uncharacterized protein An01g14990 [Aspergillus niger]A2QBE8.1 RecName: Full=Cytochrome P450 monooxygenase aunB; AltName: Full=Aurasperone B biosynthesis cluster protein B [Aspergillus niger CBS 513.88]CAK37453.1 unnamed protein product [Aspergillus niger]